MSFGILREIVKEINDNLIGDFDSPAPGGFELPSYEKGQVVDAFGESVTLSGILSHEFCLFDDGEDAIPKCDQASIEMVRMLNNMVQNYIVATRPLTLKTVGAERIEVTERMREMAPAGFYDYVEFVSQPSDDYDWDQAVTLDSHTTVWPGKVWIRTDERYRSPIKATIVRLDVLYGLKKVSV